VDSPSSYQDDLYPWNLRRVPPQLEIDGENIPHPARHRGIFVVHGIGEQLRIETAATLRSGFEDALEQIEAWQEKHGHRQKRSGLIPPPFVHEGYWADYPDLEKTFPEDWEKFNDRERDLFSRLWKARTVSALGTYSWALRQQFRLLNPFMKGQSLLSWLTAIPLQLVSFVTLTLMLIRHPRILTGYLADVRLYLDPQGLVERAIAQRIDRRVRNAFLQMLGLDSDFRTLLPKDLIQASGKGCIFERVIWVAHSLGTVISYNVLSDLFRKAAELEKEGDAAQKEGVERFRGGLKRFVTMGSPLDKVLLLFGEKAIRPWHETDRTKLLPESGDRPKEEENLRREWWVNFFSFFDPVSGALCSRKLCGDVAPVNVYSRSPFRWIPGYAHVVYWTDPAALRYMLARAYGRKLLHDQSVKAWPAALAGTLYVVFWMPILLALCCLVILYAPSLWNLLAKALPG
jgi:hypothetical protein